MKSRRHMMVAMAAVLLSLLVWPARLTQAAVSFQPQAAGADSMANLPAPAQEVLKLTAAGVSADVVNGYIGTSTSIYGLNADQVIYLQKNGVPETVITAMFRHDAVLRGQAGAPPMNPPTYASQTNQAPPANPDVSAPPPEVPPDYGYSTESPGDFAYYNDLAPYGYWNWVAGYGWGWEPYAWVADYPWDFLGFGNWWYRPNVGWCWFPGAHLRDFDRFHGRTGFAGRERFSGTQNRFSARSAVGNQFMGGQNHFQAAGRPFGTVQSTVIGRQNFGVRTFSPGLMRSSGGGVRFGGGARIGGGASFGGGARFVGGMRSGGGGGGIRGGGFHR
jgi:hypothetical protein